MISRADNGYDQAGNMSTRPMLNSCVFSEDRKYRYWLERQVGRVGNSGILFVLLNPSTADEDRDDPTVHRCMERAKRMGFRRCEVMNLFALRSTDPRELYRAHDPIGPENDGRLEVGISDARFVVCGWGRHGALHGRGTAVLQLIRDAGKIPHALGINADGSPKHPLYVGYDVQPVPMP